MSELVQIDAAARQPLPTGEGEDVIDAVCADITALLRGEKISTHPHYELLLSITSQCRRNLTGTRELEVNLQKMKGDLQKRATEGFRKYGTRLKTNNGRNPLLDAYQELLDALNYFKQAMMETKL